MFNYVSYVSFFKSLALRLTRCGPRNQAFFAALTASRSVARVGCADDVTSELRSAPSYMNAGGRAGVLTTVTQLC